MTGVQFLLCLFILLVTRLTHGKEICMITDVECTTRAAQINFDTVVPGIKGLVESSDPLYLKEVEAALPALSYRLSNLTLTGLRQCQVTQLKINYKASTYLFDLLCPHLVLNYHHKVKGLLLGAVEVDVNGWATDTFDEYILKVNGSYETLINEKTKKRQYYLSGFFLETEPKGKITYNSRSALHNDETKSDFARAYVEQNIKDVEKEFYSPTMDKFMEKLLENHNSYFRNYFFELRYPEESNEMIISNNTNISNINKNISN